MKNFLPLDGSDIAWLRMDSPTNLMIINAMMIVEGLDFDRFKATIANRFLSFERFYARPVLLAGDYLWEPDPLFDLDNHVKRVALAGRADKVALQRYLADQLSVPFDDSKPLWQMHYIENYDAGQAIILRVHHCYADGLALVSVFNAITDASPKVSSLSAKAGNFKPKSVPAAESNYEWPRYQKALDAVEQQARQYKALAQKIAFEGAEVLRDSEALRTMLEGGLKAALELTNLALMPSDPDRVFKGERGVRKTCAWSAPISFDKFSGLAKSLGCKVNDLLLSCVAGALREELIIAGEDLHDRRVHLTLPVNLRKPEDLDMAARPEALGNYFGMVFAPLPVSIENPIERVYKVKHDMQALKTSIQPALSFGLVSLAGLLPKSMQKVLLESFGNKTSGVLSNVPGTREPRYLAGAEIKEQMFWVPQTGDIALGLSIISYAGQIQFGLVGDAKLFPHAERIVARFIAQIELHQSGVVAGYIDELVQATMVS